MSETGILPDRDIEALWQSKALSAMAPPLANQVQPASLDLRLGDVAYRLRASFLPGEKRSVAECLTRGDLVMHEVDLRGGAVLETGCVYLAPLQEVMALPDGISAAMNPKSSTGRLDVFTRVIVDHSAAFDQAPAGYAGPLYVEICPRTFSILARPGDRLVQARFRKGDRQALRDITVSVDLQAGDGPIGYRARRYSGVVDLDGVGQHDAADYWEPVFAPKGRLVLDPGEFYILASCEAVEIPMNQAAEMAPVAPEIGEFRAHYAGFFDPGFGLAEAGGTGGRAVLEVRGRDVPFLIEHGQPVARLVFEPMTEMPSRPYGASGSHYQAQKLKLAKHFR